LGARKKTQDGLKGFQKMRETGKKGAAIGAPTKKGAMGNSRAALGPTIRTHNWGQDRREKKGGERRGLRGSVRLVEAGSRWLLVPTLQGEWILRGGGLLRKILYTNSTGTWNGNQKRPDEMGWGEGWPMKI